MTEARADVRSKDLARCRVERDHPVTCILQHSADTDALRAFFTEHTRQESVAVIERGLPLGMINKRRFIASYVHHRSRSAVSTRTYLSAASK